MLASEVAGFETGTRACPFFFDIDFRGAPAVKWSDRHFRNGDSMIAVIFEAMPAPGRQQEYLDLAAGLRPQLEKMDGFISIERFASLTNEGKILSLSFWRDEEAVRRWRSVAGHRAAQAKGRGGVFSDYRLRVAGVIRDYGMSDRAQTPADSRAVHDKA